MVAQDEARALGHDHIAEEHLLIGLSVNSDTMAGKALGLLDLTAERLRSTVKEIEGERSPSPSTTTSLSFTPGAKQAVDLALREAMSFGVSYVGDEHLLLGLMHPDAQDGEVMEMVLERRDVTAEEVREAVIDQIEMSEQAAPEPGPSESPPKREWTPEMQKAQDQGIWMAAMVVSLKKASPSEAGTLADAALREFRKRWP